MTTTEQAIENGDTSYTPLFKDDKGNEFFLSYSDTIFDNEGDLNIWKLGELATLVRLIYGWEIVKNLKLIDGQDLEHYMVRLGDEGGIIVDVLGGPLFDEGRALYKAGKIRKGTSEEVNEAIRGNSDPDLWVRASSQN